MIRTIARTARKPHRCSRCSHRIKPGDRYLSHTASPQHDGLGNEGWWRLPECAGCAEICRRPIDTGSARRTPGPR